MRKAIIVLIILTLTMVSSLSACGGAKEVENKKELNIPSTVETDKTKDKDKKEESKKVDLKGAKNNAEAFLEYAKKAAKDVDFMGRGDYARYMVYIDRIYEDTITNPYSGHKDMAVSNRTASWMKNDLAENYELKAINLTAIDDFSTKTKDIVPEEVIYCVGNPTNKGCVIAFLVVDGIYIYEIGENGEKKNEIMHQFEHLKGKFD